jgi:hypothetical protein
LIRWVIDWHSLYDIGDSIGMMGIGIPAINVMHMYPRVRVSLPHKFSTCLPLLLFDRHVASVSFCRVVICVKPGRGQPRRFSTFQVHYKYFVSLFSMVMSDIAGVDQH